MGKRGQGYLIGNQAFKDSQIAICLQKLNCRVIWESNITDYDFSPAPGSYIRIATESDIVMRSLDEWEMDLKAMKKFEKPVLLIEKTPITSSIFPKLQFVVCVKLGINVIPVKGPLEIARYLNRFVTQDVKPPRPMPVSAGTFNNGNRPKTTEEALVRSVQCFPGLGEVKAMALIKALSSIRAIADASEDQLLTECPTLGKQGAKKVFEFMNGRIHDNGSNQYSSVVQCVEIHTEVSAKLKTVKAVPTATKGSANDIVIVEPTLKPQASSSNFHYERSNKFTKNISVKTNSSKIQIVRPKQSSMMSFVNNQGKHSGMSLFSSF